MVNLEENLAVKDSSNNTYQSIDIQERLTLQMVKNFSWDQRSCLEMCFDAVKFCMIKEITDGQLR